MAFPVVYIAAVAVVSYLLYSFLYATDVPKIKGIPEIPGLPLFGSLLELGENHAKVAQGWAKKYGPVFQVRMGNKVSNTLHWLHVLWLIEAIENRLRQHLRLSPPLLDYSPIVSHLASHPPHLPYCRIQLAGLHNWHFSLG